MEEVEIHGWGRRPRRRALVARGSAEALGRRLRISGDDYLPRGAGMSYGDASLARRVVELEPARRFELSPDGGSVWVDAGLPIAELCRRALARGRFPPVVPGTARATIGGCVAADVHGKNHVEVGSFGAHVEQLELLVPDGRVLSCSPSENADLFWATIGGMGWTGLIVAARLRLACVAGPGWRTTVHVGEDLDALLALLDGTPRANHVVGWIDPQARGAALGRGYVERGVAAAELGSPEPAGRVTLGLEAPFSLLGPRRMRLANELLFARARWLEARGPRSVSYSSFHWPFERISDWNRWYGPRGFFQIHFAVPKSQSSVLPWAIERAGRAAGGAFAGVLKRFGPKGRGLLSFPIEGYALALDLPATPEVEALAPEIHRRVAAAGGVVYLAKDALLDPECFAEMYGTARAELARIKARIDPMGRLRGDQAERLGLFSS